MKPNNFIAKTFNKLKKSRPWNPIKLLIKYASKLNSSDKDEKRLKTKKFHSQLKTVRAKNAERLIKQGKRWERERLIMEDQERLREIAARKDRERMLEEHTLYVFDSENVNTEAFKIKNRKFTDCEIDVKDFLLSERSEVNRRMLEKSFSSQDSTVIMDKPK